MNQLNLYERKCDLTGASVISNVRPDSPYTVYRQEDWYSDKWDALTYGMQFDFSRPFFEQWKDLFVQVPRPNLFTGYEFDENSQYTNHAGKNKNCYLIFDSDQNRDCYYSYSVNSCVNCMDCFRTRKSELCYECIDCIRCYGSSYLQDCDNCSESMFLKNCTGCKKCLMCSNLKNKEYYVENNQVSKEEFETIRTMLIKRSAMQSANQHFKKLKIEFPQKYMHGVQNENVVGDYLIQCKDAYQCFDSEDLWDCRYVFQGFMPLKNCMDIQECGEGELLYECAVMGYNVHNCSFCHHTLAQMNDLLYCTLCPHCKDCFGCVGLQRKQYCILNMQYTQQEYEELVPKLIAHMRTTKEWGEFFPVELSSYAYNETMAQEFMPLTKEEALKRGWSWLDAVEKTDQYMGPKIELPETIEEVGDDICGKILTCEASGKQYKIIPQELALYRQLRLPLSKRAFFQRNKDRMALRNARVLFDRTCANCQKPIQTTYSPERLEKVFCEECYLKAVY